ncbi:MAG: hypothetical protein EOP47_22740, partial [Sphingobacteriaceae bacterium]
MRKKPFYLLCAFLYLTVGCKKNGTPKTSPVCNDSVTTVWAKSVTATNEEVRDIDVQHFHNIHVDDADHVYTIGYASYNADLDPGSGVFIMPAGYFHFLQKLDANGSFLWAKGIKHGVETFYNNPIATDKSGNVYIKEDENKVVKISPSGNNLWEKVFDGYVYDLAIDKDDNIVVAGKFYKQVDFDPGAGTFYLQTDKESDFVLKLNNGGNFIWAVKAGSKTHSPFTHDAVKLAIDNNSNIFVTGAFDGTVDIDPGEATYILTRNYDQIYESDNYLLKLNSNGNFIWANKKEVDFGSKEMNIATDASGNVYSSILVKTGTDLD